MIQAQWEVLAQGVVPAATLPQINPYDKQRDHQKVIPAHFLGKMYKLENGFLSIDKENLKVHTYIYCALLFTSECTAIQNYFRNWWPKLRQRLLQRIITKIHSAKKGAMREMLS